MEENFLILIDNFFEDPQKIRNCGISDLIFNHRSIINDDIGFYPGIRTKDLELINPDLNDTLKTKIEEMTQKEVVIRSQFHLTSSIHKWGLIHTDECVDIAGLIYLNENPPVDSGTILCDQIETPPPIGKEFSESSTTQNLDDIREYAYYKQIYNQRYFKVNCTVQNKFNRFILYNANTKHAPHNYFGNDFIDSRLVLVFWAKYI
tara:strand:+ start:2723 stop:3337 length:615 start_codon:yes stop_codon:yes gene_type:complete